MKWVAILILVLTGLLFTVVPALFLSAAGYVHYVCMLIVPAVIGFSCAWAFIKLGGLQ